jgi:hypothetical protein
MLVLWL